jgi:hypothetical protein
MLLDAVHARKGMIICCVGGGWWLHLSLVSYGPVSPIDTVWRYLKSCTDQQDILRTNGVKENQRFNPKCACRHAVEDTNDLQADLFLRMPAGLAAMPPAISRRQVTK